MYSNSRRFILIGFLLVILPALLVHRACSPTADERAGAATESAMPTSPPAAPIRGE